MTNRALSDVEALVGLGLDDRIFSRLQEFERPVTISRCRSYFMNHPHPWDHSKYGRLKRRLREMLHICRELELPPGRTDVLELLAIALINANASD